MDLSPSFVLRSFVLRPFVLSLSAPAAQPTPGWLVAVAVVFLCVGLAAVGIGVAIAARPRLRTRSRIERFSLNVGGVEDGSRRPGIVHEAPSFLLRGHKSRKRALAPTLHREHPVPALFHRASRW